MMEVVPEGNLDGAINLSTAALGKEKDVTSAALLGNQSQKTTGDVGDMETMSLTSEHLIQQVLFANLWCIIKSVSFIFTSNSM